MNKARVTIGPLLAGSLLLLTACATSTGNTQSAGNSADPTTVENCGSTQTFDATPERVVVQPHQSLELFAALGAADRVVGTAEFSSGIDSLSSKYQDRLADIPVLGDGPLSREVVVDQEPDLFYSENASYNGASVEDYAPLDIPVLHATKFCPEHAPTDDDGDIALLDAHYRDIADLGRVLDVADAADELIQSMQTDMAEARDIAAGHKPVKVASLWFREGADSAPLANGGASLQNELIQAAGGSNVFRNLHDEGGNGQQISLETLIEHKPDVIVIRANDRDELDEITTTLRHDERFADVPAVANDHFTHYSSLELFSGIRFPDVALRFANAFHPD